GVPTARRFAAAEALLALIPPSALAPADSAGVAQALAQAIREDRLHNRWGLPGYVVGRAGGLLLSLPAGVDEALLPLLDDARELVLAAVALQEDPLLARRLGVGVPGSSAGPSIVTLCALLNRAVPSLAEEGPVGTLAVLVPSVSDDGAAGPVHVPGHWISSLRGERELSGELSGCARRLEPHPDEAPALDPALLETVARFFEQRNSAGLAVALEGPVGTAAGLAGAFGRPLIEVDAARVARSLRTKTLLRILLTEAQ